MKSKRTYLLFPIIVLLVCWMASCDSGSGDSALKGSITGRIVGVPEMDISFPDGADVTLANHPEYATRADSEGNFRLEDIPSGEYTLEIDATDNNGQRCVHNQTVNVGGNEVRLGTFTIVQTGAIMGTIALEDGANPLGILAYIPGTGFGGWADETGYLIIIYIPEGTYRMRVEEDGYEPAEVSDIDVVRAQVTDIGTVTLLLPPQPACDDGTDNDGDTFTDYPDDPGCSDATDDSELGTIECDDGIDNDGDTLADLDDPNCSSVFDDYESDVWYVAAAAGGANTGKSWTDAFTVIQGAMDAATNEEMIWVAEGIYTRPIGGNEPVVLTMKDGVEIYGGFAGTESSLSERTDPASYPTILDGEDTSYHVVLGASNARFDGFTVTRGNASEDSYPDNSGAGMQNIDNVNLVVANCIFTQNNVTTCGGGVLNYNPDTIRDTNTIINCTFNNNSAKFGGGMWNNYSSPTVIDCSFINNTAADSGGALYNIHSAHALITNCVFENNKVLIHGGGGMVVASGSFSTISNCIFLRNFVNTNGGGINCYSGSSVEAINCIFIENSSKNGGAITSGETSNYVITNCTFSNNTAVGSGGAISNWGNSSATVTNCILYGNIAISSPEISFTSTSSATVTYSDVAGGWLGEGNIDADPLFVTGPYGDYYLSQTPVQGTTSPCVDTGTGTPADYGLEDTTTRTDEAPDAGTVDMGYHYPVP